MVQVLFHRDQLALRSVPTIVAPLGCAELPREREFRSSQHREQRERAGLCQPVPGVMGVGQVGVDLGL